jgi:hypothetical protein
MRFPNRAGDHQETDDILRAELKAAGIPTLQEDAGELPEYLSEFLRKHSGEVKTSVIGTLYGWEFKRAWYYWTCNGPGIEVNAAEALHNKHGKTVRVNGDCTCPSPRDRYKGLACGHYHVDDADGLKALADTIRALVEAHEFDNEKPTKDAAVELHELLPCPFCGGEVELEQTIDRRKWWGVVCRNTINVGGSCAVQIAPSASKEAAISRWNMRDGKASKLISL